MGEGGKSGMAAGAAQAPYLYGGRARLATAGRRAPWQPQFEPCQPRCPGCRGTDRARSGGVAGCNGTPERRKKEGRVSSKVSLNLLKYDLRLASTVCFNFLGSQLLPVAVCAGCCHQLAVLQIARTSVVNNAPLAVPCSLNPGCLGLRRHTR